MNINSYIKKYGDKKFSQMPFNEVDALVLSELSYVNFQLVAPDVASPRSKPLKLKQLVVDDPFSFYRGSVDAIKNRNMVKLMKKTKRYSHLKIGLCQNVFDEKTTNQFFAMTIFMPNGEAFVSFRGTDTSLLGWKEDFYIAFQEVILAQEQAVAYLNRVSPFLPERFYVGGHSKGGNLAMYGSLHAEKEVRDRIINVFSFDGPGFRKSVDALPAFGEMRPRLMKYVTKNDVIGMMFNVLPETKIVVSNGLLFGGHDPFYWQIEKDRPEFVKVTERSSASKRNVKVMMNWLASMSEDDKKLLARFLFRVFERRENVYELIMFGFADIIQIPEILAEYPLEEKTRIKAMILRLKDFYFDQASRDRKKKREQKKLMEGQADPAD